MEPSLFSVQDRVACVTGASSGLGRLAANVLAEAGTKVVAVARREQQLVEWSDNASGETAYVAADLMAVTDWEAFSQEVSAPFGAPDILINAAGVNNRQMPGEVTQEGWGDTIHLNLTVPMFLAQALAPAMTAKNWGRIVNFASLQSRRAFPGGLAYGASKGGVEQLTRAMAVAWSGQGVNANALGPGFFPTELTAPVFNDEALSQRNASQTCIGRNGTDADMIGPMMFLCSDASRYVTGQLLFVDGGFTAK